MSHLNYCLQIWGSSSKSDKECIYFTEKSITIYNTKQILIFVISLKILFLSLKIYQILSDKIYKCCIQFL